MADKAHPWIKNVGNPSRVPTAMIERAASVEKANPTAANKNRVAGSTAQDRGAYSRTHCGDDLSGIPNTENLRGWSERASSNSPKCRDATRFRG